jgi:hypothetical protein
MADDIAGVGDLDLVRHAGLCPRACEQQQPQQAAVVAAAGDAVNGSPPAASSSSAPVSSLSSSSSSSPSSFSSASPSAALVGAHPQQQPQQPRCARCDCAAVAFDAAGVRLLLLALRVENVDLEFCPTLQSLCAHLLAANGAFSRADAFAIVQQLIGRSRGGFTVAAAARAPYLFCAPGRVVSSFGVFAALLAECAPGVHARWAAAGAFLCFDGSSSSSSGAGADGASSEQQLGALRKQLSVLHEAADADPLAGAAEPASIATLAPQLSLFFWWWSSVVECLWLDALPVDVRARCMDLFMLEGEIALYRATVSIIVANEEELLALPAVRST